MPLVPTFIHVVVVLIVVGVALWLVDFIPMQSTIKSILNGLVVIAVIFWLLKVFGFSHYLRY
jgi:hypothetical protein